MARNRGFTLLELMVAVAVGAILLTLGVPSFSASVRQNCVVSGANAFLATLTLARSEALSRDTTVSICKSSDGLHCARGTGTSWNQGFLMFADPDGNGRQTATEPLITAASPSIACGHMKTNRYSNYISFGSDGKANADGSFFVIADGADDINRAIVVFLGRVRICNAQSGGTCPPVP